MVGQKERAIRFKKIGWIRQFSINKKGITTLTIKTNEITQEELNEIGKSETSPKVKMEVIV